MFEDFKKFIMKDSVVNLAVAVIMGSAVKQMVDGLINGLVGPIIGALIAGINLKDLSLDILGVKLQYGLFIDAFIKFLIISFVVFAIIKSIEKFKGKMQQLTVTTTKTCPYCKKDIDITATRCPYCTSQLNE